MEVKDCAICLERFEPAVPRKLHLECGHQFHDDCLKTHGKIQLKDNGVTVDPVSLPGHLFINKEALFTCPLCRAQYNLVMAKVVKEEEVHLKRLVALLHFTDGFVEGFTSKDDFLRYITYYFYGEESYIAILGFSIRAIDEAVAKKMTASLHAMQCTCKVETCPRMLIFPECALPDMRQLGGGINVTDHVTFCAGLRANIAAQGGLDTVLNKIREDKSTV